MRIFDRIGYAICHQDSTRSFFVDNFQFPLCGRDTGIYAGVFFVLLFITIYFLLRHRLPLQFGTRKFNLCLAGLLLVMPLEVLIGFFWPSFSSNPTRYASGVIFGTALALILAQVWALSWNRGIKLFPPNFEHLFALLGANSLIVLGLLSNNILVLWFLVFASIIGLIILYFFANLTLLINFFEFRFKSSPRTFYFLLTAAIMTLGEYFLLTLLRQSISL